MFNYIDVYLLICVKLNKQAVLYIVAIMFIYIKSKSCKMKF
jgi:hypothetical protein